MSEINFDIAPCLKHFNKFIESCGESEPDFEKSWNNGWDSCKKELLEIVHSCTFIDIYANPRSQFDFPEFLKKIEKL